MSSIYNINLLRPLFLLWLWMAHHRAPFGIEGKHITWWLIAALLGLLLGCSLAFRLNLASRLEVAPPHRRLSLGILRGFVHSLLKCLCYSLFCNIPLSCLPFQKVSNRHSKCFKYTYSRNLTKLLALSWKEIKDTHVSVAF